MLRLLVISLFFVVPAFAQNPPDGEHTHPILQQQIDGLALEIRAYKTELDSEVAKGQAERQALLDALKTMLCVYDPTTC